MKHKERIKYWFWVFRHLNYLWAAWGPFCGKARKRNHWTSSPFWSSGQGNHSHENSHWAQRAGRHQILWETSLRVKRGRVKMKGTFYSVLWRPNIRAHSLRTLAQMFSVEDELEPSAQSKSSNSTGSDASVSCHLSSSLKIPKKGFCFLPRRPLPAARLEKKDVLGLLTPSPTATATAANSNIADGGSSLKLCRGQKKTYLMLQSSL